MASLMATGSAGYSLAASTRTDIYTCAANYTATLDIWLTNRTSGVINVRLSVRRGAAADSVEQYLLYDYPLGANEYHRVEDLEIDETDVLSTYSDAVGVSANVFVKNKRNTI